MISARCVEQRQCEESKEKTYGCVPIQNNVVPLGESVDDDAQEFLVFLPSPSPCHGSILEELGILIREVVKEGILLK